MEKRDKELQDSKSKWLVLVICVITTAVLASVITYLIVKNSDKGEVKQEKEIAENIEGKETITEEKSENEVAKTSNTESNCVELIDGSCLEEDNTQVYTNDRLGIEFNYPNEWEIAEENPTEHDLTLFEGEDRYLGLSLEFQNNNNADVKATLEHPVYDTGYEVYTILEDKEYETDYCGIRVIKYEENDEILEGNSEKSYRHISVYINVSKQEESIKNNYRLSLDVPESENLNDYEDIVLQVASTFKKK